MLFYNYPDEEVLPPPSEMLGYEPLPAHELHALFLEQEIKQDPLETTQERIHVFWRLVRVLCRAKGLFDPSQNNLLMADHFDGRHPFLGSRIVSREVEELLGRPQPLPLHPCNVGHPPSLQRLQSGYLLLAYKLGISKGAQKAPMLGKHGLRGMHGTPEAFKHWFPSAEQLISYEQRLIEKTALLQSTKGVARTRKWMFDFLGLKHPECDDLSAIARAFSVSLIQGDLEEKQGMMVLRIEDFMNRCKEALDLRGEMQALKLLSNIQGLGAVGEEDRARATMKLLQSNPLPTPRLTVTEDPESLPAAAEPGVDFPTSDKASLPGPASPRTSAEEPSPDGRQQQPPN